mgnify:CR=1 FL=1
MRTHSRSLSALVGRAKSLSHGRFADEKHEQAMGEISFRLLDCGGTRKSIFDERNDSACLCHCVSRGLAIDKGIAVLFKGKFGLVNINCRIRIDRLGQECLLFCQWRKEIVSSTIWSPKKDIFGSPPNTYDNQIILDLHEGAHGCQWYDTFGNAKNWERIG